MSSITLAIFIPVRKSPLRVFQGVLRVPRLVLSSARVNTSTKIGARGTTNGFKSTKIGTTSITGDTKSITRGATSTVSGTKSTTNSKVYCEWYYQYHDFGITRTKNGITNTTSGSTSIASAF